MSYNYSTIGHFMFKTLFLSLLLCSSFLAAVSHDALRTQADIDRAGISAAARGEGPALVPEDFQDMRVKSESHIRPYMQADEIRDLTTAGTPLGEYMLAIARGDAYTAFAHYKSLGSCGLKIRVGASHLGANAFAKADPKRYAKGHWFKELHAKTRLDPEMLAMTWIRTASTNGAASGGGVAVVSAGSNADSTPPDAVEAGDTASASTVRSFDCPIAADAETGIEGLPTSKRMLALQGGRLKIKRIHKELWEVAREKFEPYRLAAVSENHFLKWFLVFVADERKKPGITITSLIEAIRRHPMVVPAYSSF